MTAALTPALTLDYLHALSADLRAAVVLGARGEALAGPLALAEAARGVLGPPAEAAAGGEGADAAGDDDAARLAAPTLFEGSTDAGAVYAARDNLHSIVAVTGPHALSRLTAHDLRSALAALGGVNPIDTTPARLPDGAVSALLRAADDGFRRPRAV